MEFSPKNLAALNSVNRRFHELMMSRVRTLRDDIAALQCPHALIIRLNSPFLYDESHAFLSTKALVQLVRVSVIAKRLTDVSGRFKGAMEEKKIPLSQHQAPNGLDENVLLGLHTFY